MNSFIYKLFSVFTSVVCFFSNLIGSPAAEKIEAKQYEMPGNGSCYVGNGRVSVHDPSLIQDKDGTYYVFGTHATAAKSKDLISWENVASGVNDNNRLLVKKGSTLRETLKEPLAWTDTYQIMNGYEENRWETGVWAADVIYNETMKKYCYYASSSVWGKAHSVIWFGVSDSIEGPYENIKTLLYSGFDKVTRGKYVPKYSTHYSFTNLDRVMREGKIALKDVRNAPWFDVAGIYDNRIYPNTIDPQVFYDKDGNLWMAYGSYYAGIYIIPLDEKTGEPDYDYMKNTEGYDIYFGKRLSCTNEATEWSGEGPSIIYDPVSDYYYLYITYSALSALGGYNIREYRSKNVDGPYVDASGNSALDYVNTGVKLFGNYKFDCLDTAYLSGGHCSNIITDDGKMFIAYHTRLNSGHDSFEARVHQTARTENGWLVVLPFEYGGETINPDGYSKKEICGEYEFINHGTLDNRCESWDEVDNIIAPTQLIKLNADGSISNLRKYESTKENTNLSSKLVDGEWSIKNGTAYISFKIDGVNYEGVLCKQKDESTDKTEKLVFSAVGNNNECIWGVKK